MAGLYRFLLLFVLVLFAARALRRLFAGILQGMAADPGPRPPGQGVQMVRDPVCGTFIVPSRALVVNDRGEPRYFCSEKCRDAYRSGGSRKVPTAR
jgi:YHS domain-containing protein